MSHLTLTQINNEPIAIHWEHVAHVKENPKKSTPWTTRCRYTEIICKSGTIFKVKESVAKIWAMIRKARE